MVGPTVFDAERLLIEPARVHTAEDVRARPCPIPSVAGVCAWYFTRVPPGVPTYGCHAAHGLPLYVGISSKAPGSGGTVSQQTVRTRIRYHFRGNAAGSTLRLTLGCLLSEELGIALRRVAARPGCGRGVAWLATS